MAGSWKVTRLWGIDVSVHWTFLLLIGWISLSGILTGAATVTVLYQTSIVLAVFGCVLLHEYGHAFAARYFGIPTHGITLLPIGGVAQLDRIPRNPWQEFVIAIAGPAVNVVIALALMLITQNFALFQFLAPNVASLSFSWLDHLLMVNVGLVMFNLLPSFPMDGGRVLRALLATSNDYEVATRWAARIGKFVAAILFVVGFVSNPMLMLVAAFVAFAGEAEYQNVVEENRRYAKPMWATVLDSVRTSPGTFQAHWGHEPSNSSNSRIVHVEITTPDGQTTEYWTR